MDVLLHFINQVLHVVDLGPPLAFVLSVLSSTPTKVQANSFLVSFCVVLRAAMLSKAAVAPSTSCQHQASFKTEQCCILMRQHPNPHAKHPPTPPPPADSDSFTQPRKLETNGFSTHLSKQGTHTHTRRSASFWEELEVAREAALSIARRLRKCATAGGRKTDHNTQTPALTAHVEI